MVEEKCSLCDMTVRNMAVHLKLNHKKKKKSGGGSFGFTGFTPVKPASDATPKLPNEDR